MLKIAVVLLAVCAAAFAQTPTVSAVVNGASFGAQLCPGLEVTIYGSNLGTSTANLSVTVGGVSGYIIPGSAFNSEVNAQLPFNIPTGPATLVVGVAGGGSTVTSAPFNITISAVSPYFTTQSAAGSGPGIFLENSTGKNVTLTTPANPGDNILAVAVGLGPTNPASPVGPVTATNSVPTLPTITVGGVNANVTFAGINPAAIGDGLYQVNFTVPNGLQGTQNVVMSLGGVTSTSVAAPQITSPVTLPLAGLSSVVNSGSFANPGTASPGSIATIFANSLGTTNQFAGLFPTTMSEGVKVTFNGTAAPLFNIVASGTAAAGTFQQLNFQQQIDVLIPTSLPTTGTVNVQLTTSTALYPNYTLTMVPANPGFYRLSGNVIAQFNGPAGLALPVATTTTLGAPACTSSTAASTVCGRPATIGDYLVLYLTGLGLATPNGNPNGTPLLTGLVAPADGSVLYETPTTPVVTVGGISANVLFSGIVPSTAGEYEIVIQVPSGVTNGDTIPIEVTMLGASDTATISIQPRAGS